MIDGILYYDTKAQSNHERPDGTREQSYGLGQWYIPAGNIGVDGTKITKEQAQDPKYALDTMAFYFSNGKQHLWTCWRMSMPA